MQKLGLGFKTKQIKQRTSLAAKSQATSRPFPFELSTVSYTDSIWINYIVIV